MQSAMRPLLPTSARQALCLLLLACSLLVGARGALQGAPASAAPAARELLYHVPLTFVRNDGQLAGRAHFYVQGSDKSLYFTQAGVTFVLNGSEKSGQRWTVRMEFVGANPVQPVGEEPAAGHVSYFRGRPSEWKTGVPTFTSIAYRELWPGIDLVCRGTKGRVKYEFRVRPGANPARIRMRYTGAESVRVTDRGDLEVSTPLGRFTDERPVAWQDARARSVGAAYSTASGPHGSTEVRFRLGPYDGDRPLIIDPAVLVYCGYIGGASWDRGNSVAVDSAGNAYIAGTTGSSERSFPAQVGPSLSVNGAICAFVAKVPADGKGLVYCGFIGGHSFSATDASAVAVDADGCAYLTGSTDASEESFPVRAGPTLTYHHGPGQPTDAWVAKVSADGSTVIYCGYIGGDGSDYGRGIAVDRDGAAYVAGETTSGEASFPVAGGPDLTLSNPLQDIITASDGFVAKVRPGGSGLEYCGYIGGDGDDQLFGIAVDGAGNAYVAGITRSHPETLPLAKGPDTAGPGIALIAKVTADGLGLAYCGYVPGASFAGAMAVDADGRAFVTGVATAALRTQRGPDLTFNGGRWDAYVARVAADGSKLDYSGYIGGSSLDSATGVAVDGAGRAYVVGITGSPPGTFPAADGPDNTFNGPLHPGLSDGWIARVVADGTALDYCGYLGGPGRDEARAVAVTAKGDAYVTGEAQRGLPVRSGPVLHYSDVQRSDDAFVARISTVPASGRLRVFPSSLAFRDVRPGYSWTLPVTISNPANEPLRVNVPEILAPFKVRPTGNLIVAPNARRKVTVTLNPLAQDYFQRTLALTSGDPCAPLVQIPIAGRAR